MFKTWRKKKSFDDLLTIESYSTSIERSKIGPDKSRLKIAVIDDERGSKDLFSKFGYDHVTFFDTYDGPTPFKPFDIILCDIDGVGRDIDEKRMGVAVAELLSKTYPEKLVFLYTSHPPKEYDDAFASKVDGFVSKNDSMSDRIKEIEKKTDIFWDPVAAWKRNQEILRKNGCSNKALAYLEDAYVRSLQEQKTAIDFDGILQMIGLSINAVSLLTKVIELFAQ